MNYIALINSFWDSVGTNPLSTGQVSLYFALLHVCNRSNWTEWFTAPNQVLSVLTGLSRSGILKARNELKQRGLIDFKERGTKATVYKIATMADSKQDSTQNSTQNGVQNSTQNGVQNSNTLNKQNKNINKTKKKDTDVSQETAAAVPYQEIADLYNSLCPSFPRLTKLSDARRKAIKARFRRYGIGDFERLFEMAESSSFLKGRNGRNWSATFDWMIMDGNMAKVLDGNYADKAEREPVREKPKKTGFQNFEERKDVDYDAMALQRLHERLGGG